MAKFFLFVSLLLLPTWVYAAQGHSVDYTINGKTYEGYFISPEKTAPLVFLVHDWDGLTDYEIKRSQMLADLGYSVFAVDLFGKGVRPTKIAEKKSLTSALYKDRTQMRALLSGGLAQAQKLSANTDNAVGIGYCFGGAAILEMARAGAPLKAFITFHGGLATPEGQNYDSTQGCILVFHGSADTSVTMDDFATLAKELEEAGIRHEMTTYSGAPHAFTVFGSDRYHKDADRKSWARFTNFLMETTGK